MAASRALLLSHGARRALGSAAAVPVRRAGRARGSIKDSVVPAAPPDGRPGGKDQAHRKPSGGGGGRKPVASAGHAKVTAFSEAEVSREEDSVFNDDLDVYRGLVLDLAYRLDHGIAIENLQWCLSSFRPINVVCWKRALCLDILEKADVLQYYDQVVKSPSKAFPIPAVLRVSSFMHTPREKKMRLSLSRNNIFLRDRFKCQYCGAREDLTIDHVRPTSRGGGWTWENLVTACSPCNLKKGDKSLESSGMKLLRVPKEPKELDAADLPPNYKTYRSLTSRTSRTPPEWLDWLPMRSSPLL
eukprot:SM000040S14784  [mRNA]  locus=s40:359020:361531:+ [translate_table: standard]